MRTLRPLSRPAARRGRWSWLVVGVLGLGWTGAAPATAAPVPGRPPAPRWDRLGTDEEDQENGPSRRGGGWADWVAGQRTAFTGQVGGATRAANSRPGLGPGFGGPPSPGGPDPGGGDGGGGSGGGSDGPGGAAPGNSPPPTNPGPAAPGQVTPTSRYSVGFDVATPTADQVSGERFSYTTRGTIDVDGDPRGYAPPGSGLPGRDSLTDCSDFVTDGAGHRVTNEFGYYASETSGKVDGASLDSSQVRYLALPTNYGGAHAGDLVYVTNNDNGTGAWGIVGDSQGKGNSLSKGAEVSEAYADALGIRYGFAGATPGKDPNLTVTVYPGTAGSTGYHVGGF